MMSKTTCLPEVFSLLLGLISIFSDVCFYIFPQVNIFTCCSQKGRKKKSKHYIKTSKCPETSAWCHNGYIHVLYRVYGINTSYQLVHQLGSSLITDGCMGGSLGFSIFAWTYRGGGDLTTSPPAITVHCTFVKVTFKKVVCKGWSDGDVILAVLCAAFLHAEVIYCSCRIHAERKATRLLFSSAMTALLGAMVLIICRLSL